MYERTNEMRRDLYNIKTIIVSIDMR